MSSEKTTELPLWVQDRDIVIAHDEEVQWREGKRPDYSYTNEFAQCASLGKIISPAIAN